MIEDQGRKKRRESNVRRKLLDKASITSTFNVLHQLNHALMFPHPTSYSTTTNNAELGLVSLKGSATLQVESKDVIPVVIYSRKDLPRWGLKKKTKRKEREKDREMCNPRALLS